MRSEEQILEEIGRHKDHIRCLEEELQYVRARESDLAPGDECEIYRDDGELCGTVIITRVIEVAGGDNIYRAVYVSMSVPWVSIGDFVEVRRVNLVATGRFVRWYYSYER